MATPTNPSFGANFPADKFRNAIINTMEMGMPSDANEQVTFHWKPRREFDIADNAGDPYDWTASPTNDVSEDKEPVIVPVAVEFVSRASLADGTPFGEIDTPKVILTLLDEQYALVRDASWVTIDGAYYDIDYVAPPMGLFEVTVYQMYASAQDEA